MFTKLWLSAQEVYYSIHNSIIMAALGKDGGRELSLDHVMFQNLKMIV